MVVGFIFEFVGSLLLHNNNDHGEHVVEHENGIGADVTSHDEEEDEETHELAPPLRQQQAAPIVVSPEQALALLAGMNAKPPVAAAPEQPMEQQATTTTMPFANDIAPSTTSSLSDVAEGQREHQSLPESPPPSDMPLPLQQQLAAPLLPPQRQVTRSRSVVALAKTNNPHQSSLPLSMRLMQHVSGIAYCQECTVVSSSSSPQPPTPEGVLTNGNHEDDELLMVETDLNITEFDYDLQALRRQPYSAISPLQLSSSPLQQHPQYPHPSTMERILTEYMAACRFYGCGNRINSGVLTTLRFSLPALRVSADFYNADMLALCEILLHHANGALRYIRRLDFSLSGLESTMSSSRGGGGGRGGRGAGGGGGHEGGGGLTSHGALTLSKVLYMAKHIEEVNLRRNNIGPFGASAIFLACFENPSSRVCKINMRRCRVGERGAIVLAELLSMHSLHQNNKNKSSSSSSTTTTPSGVRPLALREIDLSANYIGVQGCVEVDRALKQRHEAISLLSRAGTEATATTMNEIAINLEGNLVFSEVINGVTHGLGSLLSLVAVYLMHQQVKDKDWLQSVACDVYSVSLVILYISSTLFHSFFSMQQTKYIFQALDKCAIYILIAGTYTPYLLIMMMSVQPEFTMAMLAVLWSGCFLGISVEAFWKEWKWRGTFSLSMYLGMGWSALAGYSVLAPIIPTQCLHLILAGGVTYTLGVPFFVRDGFLDHAVWHMFVLAASIFHWLSIYWYVATWPAEFVENDTTTTTLSSAVATAVATVVTTLVPSSCPDIVESAAGIVSSHTMAAPPTLEMFLTQS